jgi:hypothetical protein
MRRVLVRRGSAALLLLLIGACDRIMPQRADLTLPSVEEVRAVYEARGVDADVSLSGNVVELRATQDAAQLQRGGSLWARVGPYIYVFSPGTQEVFETWAGVSAVRAITMTTGGEEVARALLTRDQLNDITWRRTLNLLGTALQEGTARPARLDDLVEWGEENTEYRYNPDYAPNQNGGR